MQKENVLIVDDEDFILQLSRDVLTKSHYDVKTASDGSEGIRLLGKHKFDLILTDIKMPNVNGLMMVGSLAPPGNSWPFCFREMKAPYIIACLLLGVSIVAEMVAKQRYSEAAQTVAKAVAASPEIRKEAKQNADAFLRAGELVSMGGLIAASVGAVLWVVSRLKGNTWTPVLPTVLAVPYAMMWLFML